MVDSGLGKEGIDIGSDILGRLMRKGLMKHKSQSLSSLMESPPEDEEQKNKI